MLENIGNMVSGASGMLAVLGFVSIGIIILALGGYMLWRELRYRIPVTIFGFDSWGNKIKMNDKGGVFVDGKTNHKRFYLKKRKGFSFDPEKVRGIIDEKGKIHTFFVQYGSKDIRILDFNLSPNPGFAAKVSEADLNWYITEMTRWDSLLNNNKLAQWLPWIGLFFVGTIFLIFGLMLISKFQVLADVANALKETAVTIAQAQSGTQVLP